METADLVKKLEIVNAAIDLYLEDKKAYNMRNVAAKLEIEPTEIYALYTSAEAILASYYTLIVHRYQHMIQEIDDYKSFTVAEKMQNFSYATFDMLTEQREFVNQTFNKYVYLRGTSSPFAKEIKKMLQLWLEEDDNISDSAQVLLTDFSYSALTREYFNLIKFWQHDDSDNAERTMALTDKLSTLAEELFYNKLFDKGIDTVKYIFQQSGFSFRLDKMFCSKD